MKSQKAYLAADDFTNDTDNRKACAYKIYQIINKPSIRATNSIRLSMHWLIVN